MAVFTPPSGNSNSTDHTHTQDDHDKDDNDIKKFYIRPSLGLNCGVRSYPLLITYRDYTL
nr:ASN_HP1_G0005060.mRNA.1.CDS.1 [Saccharomyces cerevisiae]